MYDDLRIMSWTRSDIQCRGQFMLISQQSPAVIQRRKMIQADGSCLVFWRLPFQISTGRPAYAMLLVWLTGRVSESHTRCHGYNTAWFVSDGTTGVSIVRIKVRLEWRHNRVFNGIHGYTAAMVTGEWLLSDVTTHVSMETCFYCYLTAWLKDGKY